jgi:hypothetical protein
MAHMSSVQSPEWIRIIPNILDRKAPGTNHKPIEALNTAHMKYHEIMVNPF